jgi:hypothetical protein
MSIAPLKHIHVLITKQTEKFLRILIKIWNLWGFSRNYLKLHCYLSLNLFLKIWREQCNMHNC